MIKNLKFLYLNKASQKGHESIVFSLLRHKANVNDQNSSGRTALIEGIVFLNNLLLNNNLFLCSS